MNKRGDRKIEWLGKTPSGYTLGRYRNEAGGYCYITDELGMGIYDSALMDYGDVLLAISEEIKRQREEFIHKKRKGT